MYNATILLPGWLENQLIAWSKQTPGATVDPVASHVTVLVFDTQAPLLEVTAAIRRACREVPTFRLHLTRTLQEPYWGKDGLDIVMLAPGEGAEGADAVVALREALLDSLDGLIAGSEQPLEHGEFLPHLTLTAGLPSHEAAVLREHADSLKIGFPVREMSLWQRDREHERWRFLGLMPLASGDEAAA